MAIDFNRKAFIDAVEARNITAEALAEAASADKETAMAWLSGDKDPDVYELMRLSKFMKVPFALVSGLDDNDSYDYGKDYRARLFREENMFGKMMDYATGYGLEETYKALGYMCERHMGQFRKQSIRTEDKVLYINHPLTMACQVIACGIKDDCLIAAILLHDVVEDTDDEISDLPFSDEVKELVDLVSRNGKTIDEYYDNIAKNGKACVIKITDRCNNVSTMAGCFSDASMKKYIKETEECVLPLIDIVKRDYPEYKDIVFLAKYHILSVIETIKALTGFGGDIE